MYSYISTHICTHISPLIYVLRYVWASRVGLARSVHDMAKQMYDNKKYSTIAWSPLTNWLFETDIDQAETVRRSEVLTKFTKEDDDFHTIIARCLWKLANGSNVPWGRGAVQPHVFAAVPAHEKVSSFFV